MTDAAETAPPARSLPACAPEAAAMLAALLVVGDRLFFERPVGLSLALFALAVWTASVIVRPVPAARMAGPVLLLLLGCLPVVEHLQPLSVLLLCAATLGAVAWAQGRPADWLAPLARLPVAAPLDALHALDVLRPALRWPGTRGLLSGWTLPLGGALVLSGLLVEANPLIEDRLDRLTALPDIARLSARAALWTGLALLLWPLLTGARGRVRRSAGPIALPGVNAASVARALVVFNAVLGMQTVSDATILWGGAALPDGMGWAEYAHRGAYPLLGTALLAIAFSLVAHPHLGGSGGLRLLLVLWLAQNLMLTASSGLRLSAYVEAYGYTLLRLHAAVWMVTVACGLGLALWQVWRDRSTRWLVARGAVLAASVLWGASFVNFSAIVAAGNAARGGEIDAATLCALPPTAHAALATAGNPASCVLRGPEIEGWRDWGFRAWRVRSRLAAMEAT